MATKIVADIFLLYLIPALNTHPSITGTEIKTLMSFSLLSDPGTDQNLKYVFLLNEINHCLNIPESPNLYFVLYRCVFFTFMMTHWFYLTLSEMEPGNPKLKCKEKLELGCLLWARFNRIKDLELFHPNKVKICEIKKITSRQKNMVK